MEFELFACVAVLDESRSSLFSWCLVCCHGRPGVALIVSVGI